MFNVIWTESSHFIPQKIAMGRRHGPPYEIVEVIVYDMHDADFEELEPFGTTGDDFFGLEGSIFFSKPSNVMVKTIGFM